MSKEKQMIKEMAKVIKSSLDGLGCGNFNFTGDEISAMFAEALYTEGYRKQSEWISVEERLPEKLTFIIVHDEDGTVGEAFHSYDGCFEWVANEKMAFVTHWMPLPEAPKMKGGEE